MARVSTSRSCPCFSKWRVTMCKTLRASWFRWLLAFFAAGVVLHPWLTLRATVHAESARSEPEVKPTLLPISLAQSVMLALQNSMDLKVERLSPLIREEEVRREAGVFFSPRIGLEA